MTTSDQPSLEEQITLLQGQLANAEKMTALGELLSTTTHEFNNVLMSVINYSKMGLRHKDEATRTRCLEKILSAGQRAAKITNSILGTARNRDTGYAPTDIERLIEDTLVLLEREMSKYRISIDRQYSKVPQAIANGNQIQQVLLNLLINARQAMQDGGTLIIGLSFDAQQNSVDLLVRDSGSGIAPEKLRRIFDPYFTTKAGPDESGKGGTGLGLSSCRNIIEAHKGRIRVQSTVGKGTAFTIKLPATGKPSAPISTFSTQQNNIPTS
jgi:signal transduction histidine kinase